MLCIQQGWQQRNRCFQGVVCVGHHSTTKSCPLSPSLATGLSSTNSSRPKAHHWPSAGLQRREHHMPAHAVCGNWSCRPLSFSRTSSRPAATPVHPPGTTDALSSSICSNSSTASSGCVAPAGSRCGHPAAASRKQPHERVPSRHRRRRRQPHQQQQ